MLFALILLLLVVVAGGVGTAVVVAIRSGQRNLALERLMELKTLSADAAAAAKKTGSFEDEALKESFYERVIHPTLERTADRLFKKKKAGAGDELADKLMRAGNPGGLTPAQFRALQLLMAISLVALFLFLSLIVLPPAIGILFAAVGGVFGYVGPNFWVGKRISGRQKGIKRSLPDMLDLLTVSVEAGLGFDQAVQKIVEKTEGPLSDELNRMLQEVKIGAPRKDALKAMGTRTQVDELNTLISAIIQAEQLGVSIGNILRIQSEQMRVRRRQSIEEQAQKLPIKMLFPMVGFIFPTIFIVILGPIGLKVYSELHKWGFV